MSLLTARPHVSILSLGRTLPVLLLALLVAPKTLPGQEQSQDFPCLPPRAESLRPMVEALDRARRENEESEVRRLVVQLAEEVLLKDPEGGFPVSPDRWVGPGPYLEEVIALLGEDLRERVRDAVRRTITARLRERTGEEEPAAVVRALDTRLLARLHRDFPNLGWAAEIRAELGTRYFEAGQLQAFLDLSPEGTAPELLASIKSSTAPSPALSWSKALDEPLRTVQLLDWRSGPGMNSRFADLSFSHQATFSDDRVFLQGADRVLCLNATTGAQVWRTPFLVDPRETGSLYAPLPLPRSVLRPQLHRNLVVAASRRAITAFDRSNGTIRWELLLAPLFEKPVEFPDGDTSPPEADNATKTLPPALVAAPPISTEDGILVLAGKLQDGTLRFRLALVGDDGAVRWSKAIGSANGATYLGLGTAYPAVAVRGSVAYVLTQRGMLGAHHLVDGALRWSVRYPSFFEAGSQDSLLHDDVLRNPGLQVSAHRIVALPSDSAFLLVWDRYTGELRYQIPRSDSRWWRTDPSGETLLLASRREISFWSVKSKTPREIGRVTLPDALPDFAGPPTLVVNKSAENTNADWIVPHRGGYYRASSTGDWKIRLLRTPFSITEVAVASDESLLVSSAQQTAVLAPYPSADYQLPGFPGELLRARSLLLQEEGDELRRTVQGLPSLPRGTEGTLHSERLLAFARDVLEHAEYRTLPLPEPEQVELVESILGRLPRDGFFAQAAYDQAVAAARRGNSAIAARLAYQALRSAQGTILQVTPDFLVPVELAVPRFLQELVGPDGSYPGQDLHENTARDSFARAKQGDELQAFRDVARLHPLTEGGRRATLEAARKYFRQGNRQLSRDVLRTLILIEPQTAESVDARFRLAELDLEDRRYPEARALLDELDTEFGSHVVVSGANEETVAERAQRYRDMIPEDVSTTPIRRTDLTLPLVPAWRTRTELTHQRKVQVVPLPADKSPREDLFLVASQRSVELRSARFGDALWITRFAPTQVIPGEVRFSSRGYLEAPIGFEHGAVLLTDRQSVWSVDLQTGMQRWTFELPPLSEADDEVVRHMIDYYGANDEIVLTGGLDDKLRAYDSRTGQLRWEQPASGFPLGTPEFAPGKVVIGYSDAPMVEIRKSSDGSLLRRIPNQPDEANPELLAQPPWFRDDQHCVVALQSGALASIDSDTGEVQWQTQLPAPLNEIHFLDGVEFYVAELRWKKSKPSLVGISPQTGRILWQKVFRKTRKQFHQLAFHDGDLYALEGVYPNQTLVRMQVPPVFLQPNRWEELPQVEPLQTKVTLRLPRSWEVPTLHFDHDYILAAYKNECNVAVLSRESRSVRSGRFAAMESFLVGRRNLHHASFIGDTLVLFTSRGGIGLRPKTRGELIEALWTSLRDMNPVTNPRERTPVSAAHCAYRYGDVEAACRILEDALARPGLLPSMRRSLSYLLEGYAQERGEESPDTWPIPRLSSAPVIDGSLNEDWNARTAFEVKTARYFHPIQGAQEDAASWRGWRDLSALVYAGWSSQGFHLALDVTDDSVHPYDREADRWVGDCLLLGIDYEGDGGLRAGPNDQLLTLALTVPKPAGPANGPPGAEGDEPEESDDDKPEGEYQVQRKKDGSGVIYEMTIPWEQFTEARRRGPEAPFEGLDFRLNLLLTDDDTGRGATSYFSLSPGQMLREESRGIWEVFSPAFFPRLRLVP